MNVIRALLVVSLMGLFSCREEDVNIYDGDYLIFGHAYGECFGANCVQTFKLEDDRLLEDTRQVLGQPYNFEQDYRILDQADFELAQDLLAVFPNQLLSESDSTFGCPDCYDQGGLYIEYKRGAKHGTWVIDQTQADVPAYLHEFMDRTNEIIQQLSN